MFYCLLLDGTRSLIAPVIQGAGETSPSIYGGVLSAFDLTPHIIATWITEPSLT